MSKTVLVVDDDDSSRFVLSRALEQAGYRVVVAEDGAEVGDLVTARHFDLLVLDLYMPGMNGFELLRRLRQPATGLLPAPATASSVPVVVVSGETRPASVAHARTAGADAVLGKPIDVDVFLQTIGHLLGKRPQARPIAARRLRG